MDRQAYRQLQIVRQVVYFPHATLSHNSSIKKRKLPYRFFTQLSPPIIYIHIIINGSKSYIPSRMDGISRPTYLPTYLHQRPWTTGAASPVTAATSSVGGSLSEGQGCKHAELRGSLRCQYRTILLSRMMTMWMMMMWMMMMMKGVAQCSTVQQDIINN